MSKQIHYNIDNINKENALFNLIVGEKSNGKSYQVKHKEAILYYMANKPKTPEEELERMKNREPRLAFYTPS